MAIDAWLLDQLLDPFRQPPGTGSPPVAGVLRLYRWSRPTLSLGFHQRRIAPRWIELQRRGELDLVRRPSGGRAVLHGGDLCYALIWPGASGSRQEVYQRACHWLQQAFAGFGLPLRFGRPLRAAGQPLGEAAPGCFSSQTAADLIDASGQKRVGSAQLWRRGCLLQHGSIPLAPSPQLWRRVLAEAPPAPLPIDADALIAALRRAAEVHLLPELSPGQACSLEPWELSATELASIAASQAAQERPEGPTVSGG